MATTDRPDHEYLQEGTMFRVPLVEGFGFGFGYIALARQGWGYLADVYDVIADSETPPEGLEASDLVVHNLLVGDGVFAQARYNPKPWQALDRRVGTIRPVEHALFQIGGKIHDMRSGETVEPAGMDRGSLPYKEYPLDDEHSYLVTARLLRCDFRFNETLESYELVR